VCVCEREKVISTGNTLIIFRVLIKRCSEGGCTHVYIYLHWPKNNELSGLADPRRFKINNRFKQGVVLLWPDVADEC
jgi:hypothetical protein